jgi:phosphoesterase RecJ-like protein
MNMSDPNAWAEAEGLLRRAQRILAITHVSPDGDALGSLLGFTHAMRSQGKVVTPACQDQPHPRFSYLPGVHDIKQIGESGFDLVVSLDASDLGRLGSIYIPAQHATLPMVMFDHHITNTGFGTVNVNESGLSSTSEVVLRLIRRMNLPITHDMATCLLTGIITDTMAFRTSNTTPDTLAAAMELMRSGGNLQEVTRQALTLRSFDSLRFLGAGIAAAKLDGRIVYATLPRKLRKEIGVKEERGDAGLVSMLIATYEAAVAAVFVELANGDIEISLRAQPGFDVTQVALELGGGGHPAAAGFTLPGPARDAVSRVIPRLKQLLRET